MIFRNDGRIGKLKTLLIGLAWIIQSLSCSLMRGRHLKHFQSSEDFSSNKLERIETI